MKNKLILHIGPHKTGSTYLQKSLSNDVGWLASNGWTYPTGDLLVQWGHHSIAENYYTGKHQLGKAQIANYQSKNLILSSENFDRLSQSDVDILSSDLAKFDVTIVFFKRNLGDVLISSWQESIKHGSCDNWAKYCFDHILKPFESSVLNIEKILSRYSKAFGENSIKVIDYDFAQESKDDLFDVFLKAMQLKRNNQDKKLGRVNKSMDYASVELLRRLNFKFKHEFKKNPHHYVREAYLSLRSSESELAKVIESVIEKTKRNISPIELQPSFTLNFMEEKFKKTFSKRFVNPPNEKAPPKKSYALPDEFCLWGEDANIEKIYQNVISSINN